MQLQLELPDGGVEEPASALPAVDVAGLPGAVIVVRRGFSWGDRGAAVHVVCAKAGSERWAPGLEDLVFGRATAIAQGAAGGPIERFEVGPIEVVGSRFQQCVEGDVRRDGEPFALRGRHFLGFAGDARDAVFCTALCVEPAASVECAHTIDSAVPEGAWRAAPPPNAAISAILLAAERPATAAAIAGAAALLVLVIVFARRPRPRA